MGIACNDRQVEKWGTRISVSLTSLHFNSLQYHKKSRIFCVVVIKVFMILASRKFMHAVPETWFLSTVKKDDVKIIKMFYDIPATVYGTT